MHVGRAQNALSAAQTQAILAQNLRTSAVVLGGMGVCFKDICNESVPARPVGFSNVMPTSAESHLQWLQ